MTQVSDRKLAQQVASAIKTDFILSAEIMAITLAALPAGSIWKQALVLAVLLFCTGGFFPVQPHQGQVLQLFGHYAGTVRDAGLRWTNPFYSRRAGSLRVRNFESGRPKG
ncbi:DUF808 family protein, partial [Lacticaseibacillus rhamnosus]